MNRRIIAYSALTALAVLCIAPFFGPAQGDWHALFAGDSAELRIFFELRVSRTLLAMLAGGSLAVAGAVFQALLRNSLATPYTLGVSSGAALGAVLAITLRVPFVWLNALGGGLLVLFLVLRLSKNARSLPAHALILAGVSVTSVCSALITVLHTYAGFSQAFSITSWLIGGIDAIPYASLTMLAAAVVPVWGYITYSAPAWNLIAFGEAWAEARGLPVRRTMTIGYIAGSWLAALTVAFTGPIGFVGLLVPHVVRGLAGPDHRTLIPATVFFGAAFLGICDALGRSIFAPSDVPAGVITAALGGPGLIWILRREKNLD